MTNEFTFSRNDEQLHSITSKTYLRNDGSKFPLATKSYRIPINTLVPDSCVVRAFLVSYATSRWWTSIQSQSADHRAKLMCIMAWHLGKFKKHSKVRSELLNYHSAYLCMCKCKFRYASAHEFSFPDECTLSKYSSSSQIKLNFKFMCKFSWPNLTFQMPRNSL